MNGPIVALVSHTGSFIGQKRAIGKAFWDFWESWRAGWRLSRITSKEISGKEGTGWPNGLGKLNGGWEPNWLPKRTLGTEIEWEEKAIGFFWSLKNFINRPKFVLRERISSAIRFKSSLERYIYRWIGFINSRRETAKLIELRNFKEWQWIY